MRGICHGGGLDVHIGVAVKSLFVLPTPHSVVSPPPDLTETIARSSRWFLALSQDPPNACFFLEPKNKDGPVMFGIAYLLATEHTVEGVLAQWPDASYSVKLDVGPKGIVSGSASWGSTSLSSTAVTGVARRVGNVDDCFRRIRSAGS